MIAGNSLNYVVGKSDDTNNVGQMYFHYADNSSGNNRLSFGLFGANDILNVMGNGNVGIGTPGPTVKLEVV